MTEKTPSPPPEGKKLHPWPKSPGKEVEDSKEHSTVTGDDNESGTDGTHTYYYTAEGNSSSSEGGREGEGFRDHGDTKNRGDGGGSAGETSTAESSECSSSKGWEDGTSEGLLQSRPFTRLAGTTVPMKGKGDITIGNRLVSRFWKELPADEKKHWATMPIEKKREFYKCKSRYVTLDKIDVWSITRDKITPSKKGPPPSSCEPVPWLDSKISLWRGDITYLEIDAIVNAANTSLLGGGGVDGAIHSAAGKGLLAECETMGGCPTGLTKMTTGYQLPAKFVLHTVGPMNRQKAKLESCYKTCLSLVKKHKIRTVAFPCVSTGIFGYPNEEAAEVAIKIVKAWLENHEEQVDRIIFCVFLEKDLKIYRRKLFNYFPPCSSKAQEEALLKARELKRAAAAKATGTSETTTPYSTASESVGDRGTESSSMDTRLSGMEWTSTSGAGTSGGEGGGGGGSVWGESERSKDSSVWGEEDTTKKDDENDKN